MRGLGGAFIKKFQNMRIGRFSFWGDRRRVFFIALFFLFLISIVMRLWPVLADRPLWYDEVCTWHTAYNSSLFTLFIANAHKEHPPLSYLFVRAAMELFGAEKFWAMRLPSLAFGLFCVPAAFAAGKRLISERAGLLLALLVSLDQLMIEQSQQARMYTLFILLLLLALRQFSVAMEHSKNSYTSWAVLGLFLGVLGWTHQLAIIVWLGFFVGICFFLLQQRQELLPIGSNGGLKKIVLVFGLAILIDLPPLLQLLRRLKKPNGSGVSGDSVGFEVLTIFSGLLGSFPVYLLVMVVSVIGLVFLYRNANRGIAITVAAIGVLTLCAQFPLAQTHHQFSVRYLIPFLIVVWIGLVAAIIHSSGVIKKMIVLIVFLYVSGSFYRVFDSTFVNISNKYLYGAASDFIMKNIEDGEFVLFYPVFYSKFSVPYAYRYGRKNYFYGNTQGINFQKKNREYKTQSGVWIVLLPDRLRSDIEQKKENIGRFTSMVQDLELDLQIADISRSQRKNPLVFHFRDNMVKVWEIKATGPFDAIFLSVSAGGAF